MLKQETIQIIRSTVPVLETHGTAITKRFYELMFRNHPELLNIFNHANQKQGRQQTALANAVYAAAVHIDKLETILPAVRQIAHKHRSLGVTPDQYPIVGRHLLAAIKEVLGEAATDEILNAWAEAYGVIADAFIATEADMYKEAETKPGGWSGFRPFRVARKVRESDVIASFYLVPEDGGELAAFEPGQYVSVKMDLTGHPNTHIRQYSLSDAPGKPHYRITVKREDARPDCPEGVVSSYLHKRIGEGDRLLLSAPAGDFTLAPARPDGADRPVVLISGGVGLTPLTSMLLHLQQTRPDRKVTFIHAAINGRTHALKADIAELARNSPNAQAYFCYESPDETDRREGGYAKEGRIDLPWLQSVVPSPDAEFYFCGPVPFMKQVYRDLLAWGVRSADIHYEFFGPAGSLAESADASTSGSEEKVAT